MSAGGVGDWPAGARSSRPARRRTGGRYVRATVAYDGTDFAGFQIQAGVALGSRSRRTVQGVLERALEQITREPIRVVGAGRTDAGVHALGQVVAFHTEWSHPLTELLRAWNATLPDDVCIVSLSPAEEGFHPRFDAVSRAYRYTLWNHPVHNPLLRRTALWVSQALDVDAIGVALERLVGEHDFATFGTAPGGRRAADGTNSVHRTWSVRRVRPACAPSIGTPGNRTTVRRVFRATCTWSGSAAGPLGRPDDPVRPDDPGRPDGFHRTVYLDIEANAFLYRMVRSIVGTILQVGRGKLSPAQFASILEQADRSQAGPTAPPHGLCLIAVNYQA